MVFALLVGCTYNSNLVVSRPARIELAMTDAAADACARKCATAPVFADCLAQCPGHKFDNGACPTTVPVTGAPATAPDPSAPPAPIAPPTSPVTAPPATADPSGVAPPQIACATIELRSKAVRQGKCEEQQVQPGETLVSCDTNKHLTGGGLAAIIGGAIVGFVLIVGLEVLALSSGPL